MNSENLQLPWYAAIDICSNYSKDNLSHLNSTAQ